MTEGQENPAGSVAIVIDERVVSILLLNDLLYAALTSSPIIVDLKDNPDQIDEMCSYNPITKQFSRD